MRGGQTIEAGVMPLLCFEGISLSLTVIFISSKLRTVTLYALTIFIPRGGSDYARTDLGPL